MGRPDSELYRGTRLAQALDWQAQAERDLTTTERDFLDAGRRLADAEEQRAAQQTRQQKRINRRLRGLLAGVAFLLIAALVAGSLAVRQANRATDATAAADARRAGGYQQRPRHLEFSHDGELLASASVDQTSIVWNVRNGRRLEELQLDDVWGDIRFSNDDRLLYTTIGGGLRAFDVSGTARFVSAPCRRMESGMKSAE